MDLVNADAIPPSSSPGGAPIVRINCSVGHPAPTCGIDGLTLIAVSSRNIFSAMSLNLLAERANVGAGGGWDSPSGGGGGHWEGEERDGCRRALG